MAGRFDAVLFDWRGALFHDQDEADWIRASAASIGRTLTSAEVNALVEMLPVAAEHPEQAIILFSAYLDPDIVERAAQLGIRACMSKREISQVPEALWKYAPET